MSHRPRLIPLAAAALALMSMLLLPAGPALADIQFRAASTAVNTSSSTSITIDRPSSSNPVQEGDLLLAQIVFLKGNTLSIGTIPADWVLVQSNNQSSNVGSHIYRKFAGPSEPTSYTWSGFSQTASAVGGILAYSGVDSTNPIIASDGSSAASGNLIAPSIAAEADSRLIAFFGMKKRTTLTTPGGMTERYFRQNLGDEVQAKAADQTISTGPTTGTRTSMPGSSAEWVAQSVTLREAPPPSPLVVEKTAVPAIEQTIDWEIEKTVEPESWDLFRGDTGTSEYTISVTKEEDNLFTVSGEIEITNPSTNTVAANITNVTDEVSGVGAATVVCPGGLPQSLNPGQKLTCDYGPLALPNGDTRTNTATVTSEIVPAGDPAEAEVDFTGVEPILAAGSFASVSIDDDNDDGDKAVVTGDDEYSYEVSYACDDDDGAQNNTATVIGGEDEELASDSASVSVTCHELEVAKTVDPEFTRTWTWGIEKESDGNAVHNPLVLAAGQQYQVNYTVTVDAGSADSEHKITGTITIKNPSPRAATLTAVTDAVNDTSDTAANVDCPPLSVPADGTLECTYELDSGDDGTATLNTATATLQNFDYDSEGVGTASGTTDFEGRQDVSFDNPTNEVDKCADVSDSEDAGTTLPAESCATEDPHEQLFEYARFIGPFSDPEQCDAQEALNTASFETKDSDPAVTGSDDHTVFVNVTCEDGGGGNGTCTLSQGYWKTHSAQGPAPYDDNWANLGSLEENTIFYPLKNTQTYRQVLWTPPQGNAYYILARQYIAAQLNGLNGSDLGEIEADFNAATALFETWKPGDVAKLKGNNATRQEFLRLAGILGAFNEDNHCDEDETSAP